MGGSLGGGSIRVLWGASDSAEVTISGGVAAFTVNGSAVTFPYTLSSSTTFETTHSGVYTVSVEHHGYEIAGTPDGTREVELRSGAQHIFEPTIDGGRGVSQDLMSRLSSAYAGRTASPRGGQRASLERRPVLTMDYQFPNAVADYKILHADGSTLYAQGVDMSLRRSDDGGLTWERKLYYTGGLGHLGWKGLFHKTTAGTLITTYHPVSLAAPKIMRSTDGGTTWVDVVAAQADVDYLGPTSIVEDPVTGYLYLTEYVTVSAATKATWKISRSTDDGATWTTFHTFQRDATANPTTAVRHGHSAQWDPISQRVYFLCGDSEQAAGLYRVNAGGTDVEAVVVNSQLDTAGGTWAGAVGVMFFPNVIAWGCDQVANSGLLVMARDQIGQPSPVVERTIDLQATSWYTMRTDAAGNDEWLMFVSSENGVGGRLDNAMHIYRVAEDATEVDEVATLPVNRDDSSYSYCYPIGDPLEASSTGAVWIGATTPSPLDAGVTVHGCQFRARLAWGAGAVIPHSADRYRLFHTPISVSSGNQSLTALQVVNFGVTECPPRMTRLYIIEVNREQFSGTGFAYVEVYNQSTGAILKAEDTTTDLQFQNRSRRSALNEQAAPYIIRSVAVSPGQQIRFRLREILNNTAEACGTVTYAWGIDA